ncbi:MAG: family mycofactocin-dependent oxidoreductase [Pseudonocardiales bacterium]|nr:family mycofactocin-dependent oxidoreductase [Pseudonocardiales bacterium]
MNRLQGKVAFITGAARGQGRSHAVRLAQEGADIIAIDINETIPSIAPFYPGATDADLAETVRQVEALDRRIVATKVDVRDFDAICAAVNAGVATLGRLDIVSANAGIFRNSEKLHEVSSEGFDDIMDVNIKGVWQTCKAVIPYLIEQGQGGSIILTSSAAGLKGTQNIGAYVASKHAVLGLMRSLANELGQYSIRVNTVHPTGVNTAMIINESTFRLFMPGVENPSIEAVAKKFQQMHSLPVPWVEPVDVSNAVLFLASDEARYITGTELKVDAGFTIH